MIVDSGGFILARRATYGSEGDWKPAHDMLEQLPIKPETLAADTGYSAGLLRQKLEDLGISAYIPIHPNQDNSVVARMGFTYHGDHLVCPEGKTLRRLAFLRKDSSYQYVALQKDCQICPVRTECLPPGQKRRYVALTMYQPVYLRARHINREMKSRHATVEGVFASLDRLGWERCKLRGLRKVDCEGYISALAHNLSKAVRKLGGMGPPASAMIGERAVVTPL